MIAHSSLQAGTLLFILLSVSSYSVVGSFRSANTFPSRTRLFSYQPKPDGTDETNIIDPTTISVGDVWEDHYFESQSAGLQLRSEDDDEKRHNRSSSPTTRSHSYVSHLVRAMKEDELDAFIADHRHGESLVKAWVSKGKQSNNEEDEATQQQTAEQRKDIRRPDTYVDEPYRHLRLLRRRLPDPLWSQIRLEAEHALTLEPDAGPQLYQHVLRQPSLMDALASIISHEIETELMPATALRTLVMDQLRLGDDKNIHLDVVASVNRSPSEDSTALNALLFHQGLHCLVCYRVAHRLWQAGRTGLAYYMQSTVSSHYAADIHPACEMEGGIYLSVGGGVVIGETARVGRGVTILQGVTLGGTGKEVGDRHPKVEDGVLLHPGATVLGNIRVGKGAVVTAKSIVTKEVPDLARVSGVPAKVRSYRELWLKGYDEDARQNMWTEECDLLNSDLDCVMGGLSEEYLVELEALVQMETCIDAGDGDCWNTVTDILNSDSQR